MEGIVGYMSPSDVQVLALSLFHLCQLHGRVWEFIASSIMMRFVIISFSSSSNSDSFPMR